MILCHLCYHIRKNQVFLYCKSAQSVWCSIICAEAWFPYLCKRSSRITENSNEETDDIGQIGLVGQMQRSQLSKWLQLIKSLAARLTHRSSLEYLGQSFGSGLEKAPLWQLQRQQQCLRTSRLLESLPYSFHLAAIFYSSHPEQLQTVSLHTMTEVWR